MATSDNLGTLSKMSEGVAYNIIQNSQGTLQVAQTLRCVEFRELDQKHETNSGYKRNDKRILLLT